VFIPLAVYVTLPHATGRSNGGRPGLLRRLHDRLNVILHAGYDLTFGKLNHGYGHVLGFFLKRRLDLVVVLLLLFGATVGVAFQHVSITDSQEDERGGFEIDVVEPGRAECEVGDPHIDESLERLPVADIIHEQAHRVAVLGERCSHRVESGLEELHLVPVFQRRQVLPVVWFGAEYCDSHDVSARVGRQRSFRHEPA